MKRTFTCAVLLTLGMGRGYAQSQLSSVVADSFEVASITPCKPGTSEPPGEHAGMVQFTFPGGRFKANATTLKFLLEWAYGMQPSQHSGGPAWMESDRFDVVAKAAGNPGEDQMKRMMQTLLSERFKLKLHHDSRKLQVYVVSLGKTAPKLFPPKEGEAHSIRIAPQTGQNQEIVSYHVIATRFSLTQLTDIFARQLGRVIVNRTGLDGEFDFSMDFTPDENRPNPLDPALVMSAMREQLGLVLKSEETPVDILVIDSAEKAAAGN